MSSNSVSTLNLSPLRFRPLGPIRAEVPLAMQQAASSHFIKPRLAPLVPLWRGVTKLKTSDTASRWRPWWLLGC